MERFFICQTGSILRFEAHVCVCVCSVLMPRKRGFFLDGIFCCFGLWCIGFMRTDTCVYHHKEPSFCIIFKFLITEITQICRRACLQAIGSRSKRRHSREKTTRARSNWVTGSRLRLVFMHARHALEICTRGIHKKYEHSICTRNMPSKRSTTCTRAAAGFSFIRLQTHVDMKCSSLTQKEYSFWCQDMYMHIRVCMPWHGGTQSMAFESYCPL